MSAQKTGKHVVAWPIAHDVVYQVYPEIGEHGRPNSTVMRQKSLYRLKKAAIQPRNFFCPKTCMVLALPLLLYSNDKKRGPHRWHLTK